MSSNPFSSRERQHFPEFSPMFSNKRVTPTSTEKQTGFRWSIDQIARLKPADIDTDPATLVKTNGHSPDNNADTQKDVDKFFSQKTILPSPWPTTAGTSRLPLQAKRVTFSPHPPSTAFIREEASLVQSEIRDSRTADAGTQTTLTFPMNFDLEHLLGQCLLGQVMNHMDEDSARDLGNSSLRRKLFGKPDRQGSPDSTDSSEGVDAVSPVPMMTHTPHIEVSHGGLVAPPAFTPILKKSSSKVSLPSGTSTPFHPSHPHSPHLPSSHYLQSPAIVFTNASTSSGSKYDQNHRESLKEERPAHSSMVLQTPGKDVPFFSPIGSEDGTKTGSCDGLSDNGSVGRGNRNSRGCVNNLFPVTPDKETSPPLPLEDHQLRSPLPLSPIVSTTPTAASPMVVCEGSKVKGSARGPNIQSSNQAKCTSTPNTGVMKRQLASSPFASPVLKHPCTARPDMEEDEDDETHPNNNNNNNNNEHHFHHQHSSPPLSLKQERCNDDVIDGNLSEEMAQPLSLADLHTSANTYDLTNVTSMASCYTAMDLGEPDDFDDNTANGDSRQHPLHSTAAFMASSMFWHPPIQSILAESQSQTRLNSLSQQQHVDTSQTTKTNMLSQQNQGSSSSGGGGVHVPYYGRNWSHVQAPTPTPVVSTSISQSGIDSGVAVAFSELSHGGSGMMNSKFASGVVDCESGLSASISSSRSRIDPQSSLQSVRSDGLRNGDHVGHVNVDNSDSNECKPMLEDGADTGTRRTTSSKDDELAPFSSCVHELTPFRSSKNSGNPALTRVNSKHHVLSTIKESEENHLVPSSSSCNSGVTSDGDGDVGAETTTGKVQTDLEKRRLHVHAQLERDSGLFSPEARSDGVDINHHRQDVISSGMNRFGGGAGTLSSPILTPPSRHSNLVASGSTYNMATAKPTNVESYQNMYTSPHHVPYGHSNVITSGTVASLSSNVGSKFTAKRGAITTHTRSVLPSRLKLGSGSHHTLSSSNSPTRTQQSHSSPMSTNVTPSSTANTNTANGRTGYGRCGEGVGLGAFGNVRTSSSSSEAWQSSPSFHRTPPSRYSSGLGSLKLMSGENSSYSSCSGSSSGRGGGSRKTGLTGFPGDVLRKKETLKARLQFSSTNSQYSSNVGTSHMHRIPLGETSLNCPKTSLVSMTTTNHYNEGVSPLSSSPINLTRSPWQLPLPFSPLHRPITSLSHASHVSRWKTQT